MNPHIGIRLHDAAPGTLAERAGFVQAQGFTCVHLALGKTIGPETMEPEAATPELAQSVIRDLKGLQAAVLGCYLNLTHPDEGVYQETARKYEAHLRLAKWMGALVVGTETGNPNAEYAYDPERSHSEAALDLFIRRVEPIVKVAEKIGAILAIEPVYTHIVYGGRHARRVLEAVSSPNLKIILDPVNLLHPGNLARREEVVAEAIELLGDFTEVFHLKDYVPQGGNVRSVAAGTGEMDYSGIARFIREHKPDIPVTLEDTNPQNAEGARIFVHGLIT